MAKKFGDVVVYQMGKVSVNALVVQSNPQPDGEHLVVAYLDPALASNSMAGALVDKAIAKAFPSPLSEGKAYGWKDLPTDDRYTEGPAEEFLDKIMPHLIELSHTVAEISPHMDISPDGTLISAKTLLQALKPDPPFIQPKDPSSVADVVAAQQAASAPSAAGLDAAAEEQKAKEATVTSTSSFSEPSKVTNGL